MQDWPLRWLKLLELLRDSRDFFDSDRHLYPSLVSSCKSNELEKLKMLISKLPNSSIVEKSRCLHAAIEAGNFEIIQFLFENKHISLKYLTQHDREKPSPLDVACSKGYFKIVKYFVELGCSFDGYSALRNACKANQLEILKYLLLNGFECKSYRYNNCCFEEACSSGLIEIVKFFIERGKDCSNQQFRFTERSSWCFSPTFLAAESGQIELLKYLLEENSTLENPTSLKDLQLIACENNQLEILKYLISIGIDSDLFVLFHNSSARGYTAILEYLISIGVQPVGNPLDQAFHNDDFKTMKLLISNGFVSKVSDFIWNLKFWENCLDGNLENVKFLNSTGTKKRENESSYGQFIAFICEKGDLEMLQYLITVLGCSTDLWRNLIEVALNGKQNTIIQYLLTVQCVRKSQVSKSLLSINWRNEPVEVVSVEGKLALLFADDVETLLVRRMKEARKIFQLSRSTTLKDEVWDTFHRKTQEIEQKQLKKKVEKQNFKQQNKFEEKRRNKISKHQNNHFGKQNQQLRNWRKL